MQGMDRVDRGIFFPSGLSTASDPKQNPCKVFNSLSFLHPAEISLHSLSATSIIPYAVGMGGDGYGEEGSKQIREEDVGYLLGAIGPSTLLGKCQALKLFGTH